ncbi:hypothetical protein [Bacillus sp. FJAT-27251]|uniref:hypothetical protein n=1 Tax=Bacillus sp. FJAT-27251 TaxID=1684142 RepID=UPI000B31360D|nr:hypothetical protein [Bacillus sp. FJAT-27251]
MEDYCVFCGMELPSWQRDGPSCQNCRDAISQAAYPGDLYGGNDEFDYEPLNYDR